MGGPFRRCHGSRNLELGDVKADRAKQGISHRRLSQQNLLFVGRLRRRKRAAEIHKLISQMSLDGLSGLLGHVPEHKS